MIGDPKPRTRPRRRRLWRNELTDEDRAFVEFCDDKPCSVPGCDPAHYLSARIDFDHVPTLGSQGKAHAKGWPLCRRHHSEKGALGITTFQEKYDIRFNRVYRALRKEFEECRNIRTA